MVGAEPMKYKFSESDIEMLRRMANRERRLTNQKTIAGHTLPRMLTSSGVNIIKLAVMNEDIAPGETKAATRWENNVTPPTATTETVQVTLDWMAGTEPIDTGKQIGYVVFGGVNRIMWSECPDPAQKQTGDETDSGGGVPVPPP